MIILKLLPKEPVKTLIIIAYIALAALLLVFVLPRAITYLLPFIVAGIVSVIITPLVNFMSGKLKLPRKLSTLASIVIVLALIGLFAFNLVYQAVYFLQNFALGIPDMISGGIELPGWVDRINDYFIRFPEPMQQFIDNITDNLISNISEIIQPATTATINLARSIASKLPNIIVFTVVTIMATYFISNDKKQLSEFARRHLSEGAVNKMRKIKNGLYHALGAYVRAQLIMMCIMFTLLIIGFAILGIDSPLFIAFITAIVDAIPILGTGTVLIPWAIISLVLGDFTRGIGLGVLYVCALVVRQFTEPRIVSLQIGLHPLITLVAMYAGLVTFGLFGMILGPIITIVVIKAIEIDKQTEEEM